MKFSDYVSDPLCEWVSEVDDGTQSDPPDLLCCLKLWPTFNWRGRIALVTVKVTTHHVLALCGRHCVWKLTGGIRLCSIVPGMNLPENSVGWQVTQFTGRMLPLSGHNTSVPLNIITLIPQSSPLIWVIPKMLRQFSLCVRLPRATVW